MFIILEFVTFKIFFLHLNVSILLFYYCISVMFNIFQKSIVQILCVLRKR